MPRGLHTGGSLRKGYPPLAKSSEKTVFEAAAFFIIAVLILASGGCASKKGVNKEGAGAAAPPVVPSAAPAAPAATAAAPKTSVPSQKPGYEAVLGRWTGGAKIYEGIETRLIITATYKGFPFREAYIERYAKGYQLDDDYKKSLIEREKEAVEEANEFFFTAYTPEDRWNDFDSKDSIWRLFLEDDTGKRLVPLSVKRAEKGDPFIREFFPYIDPWSAAYTVKFPKYSAEGKDSIPGNASKFLKLTVTGILGKGEIIWQLKK